MSDHDREAARARRAADRVAAHRWRLNRRGELISPPIRCRRGAWYLARARLPDGAVPTRLALRITFQRGDRSLGTRCLRLHPAGDDGHTAELLGWFETPARATRLRLGAPTSNVGAPVTEVALHEVAERDPKCHPLANVPRWATYRAPLAIRRIVLPSDLAELPPLLDGIEVQIVESPGSTTKLERLIHGAACVVDPRWARDLDLRLSDIERLASCSWLVLDLETTVRVLSSAGVADASTVTYASRHGLMSARVEYADVPTRGLALQDVVPFATLDERDRFRVRALKAGRAWKRYADETGFATLLSAETPWERRRGDVLSALRAVGGGEWVATDLPWLLAGRHGRLVAPRIAAHLLRMHLALPLADHLQYWNRWDSTSTVVRDIADLARRYPPLHAVRWALVDASQAHLGVMLLPSGATPARHLYICTGRIDVLDLHAGVPPEPMMIFMKWLAREARERTVWAERFLTGVAVTWQFDTADGLKYAVNYDAAPEPLADDPGMRLDVVRVRMAGEQGSQSSIGTGDALVLPDDEGLYGDRSLEFQEALTRHLRRIVERGGG